MANVRREAAPEVAAYADHPAPVVTRTAGLTAQSALEALGPMAHGGHVFVLSKGAVSAGDVLAWALEQTGDADVLVSTWTISPEEIHGVKRLVDSGRIRSFRLLTDFSFANRHPSYAALLRATFGPEAIAVTVCHAKVATVINAAWALAIRTSANLNRNSRTEYHEVSDDRGLADFINATLGAWFPAAADTWAVPVAEHRRRFDAWGETGDPASGAARAPAASPAVGVARPRVSGPATAADAAFFEAGPYGRDLRRVGLSYAKG
jgi:hypothetical protein